MQSWTLIFLLGIAACLHMALAGNVRYRSCGKAKIKKFSVNGPTPTNKAIPTLYRGETYQIKVVYESAVNTNSLWTGFYAIMNGATLPWEGIELKKGCDSVKEGCPLRKGKRYTYIEDIHIPSDVPQIRTVVKLKQEGDNGDCLCVLFALNIK